MATGTLTLSQKIPFTIAPADANGNPQAVEGLTVVALNDADLTSEINADNLGGFVVAGATTGSFQIQIQADAKLGEGEVLLSETHDIIVESDQAVTLGGTFGAPVPK